uniref:OJ1005_B10.8 protein n=1 Tax=Oryza sativa subsp. japonica TaxID=39947 RepID=Q7EZP4_ORYSJ|nr:OJ1005_B10.8 [Oryza sativa Japonica Group]
MQLNPKERTRRNKTKAKGWRCAEIVLNKNATTIHDIADGVKDGGGGGGTRDLPLRMRSRTETATVAPERSHADGVKDSGGCGCRADNSGDGLTAVAPEAFTEVVDDGGSYGGGRRHWWRERKGREKRGEGGEDETDS